MRQNIDDREVAGFLPHLRVEEHLQKQIAQFFGQIRPVLALDRVQHLVSFFQRICADGGKALLAIPGASTRPAQTRHARDALLKQCARFLLAHVILFTDTSWRRSTRPRSYRGTFWYRYTARVSHSI